MLYPKTEQKIASLIAQDIFPGVNYAFIKAGKVWQKTLGLAQKEPVAEPLTPHHLYDVASLTKVIGTNSLILKLWEAGALDLDAPLQTYLPTFVDPDITLLELLTHTSDVQAYIPNRDHLSPEELKQALLSLKPGAKKGQVVTYTDTGSLLFGFLCEHLEQAPIQEQIMEKVLIPLGMTESTFQPDGNLPVAPTESHSTRGLIKGTVHDPKAWTLGKHCGSAGLFSTLKDCLTFINMMLEGGLTKEGTPFLKPDTIQALVKDWTGDPQLMRSLAWDLLPGKPGEPPLLYHTGYTGTFMIIDLHHQEAFIFLSNRVHPVDHREAYVTARNALVATYLNEK